MCANLGDFALSGLMFKTNFLGSLGWQPQPCLERETVGPPSTSRVGRGVASRCVALERIETVQFHVFHSLSFELFNIQTTSCFAPRSKFARARHCLCEEMRKNEAELDRQRPGGSKAHHSFRLRCSGWGARSFRFSSGFPWCPSQFHLQASKPVQ